MYGMTDKNDHENTADENLQDTRKAVTEETSWPSAVTPVKMRKP